MSVWASVVLNMKAYIPFMTINLATLYIVAFSQFQIQEQKAVRHGLFPNAVIPYEILEDIDNSVTKKNFNFAIEDIQNSTCLRFSILPRRNSNNGPFRLVIRFSNITNNSMKFVFTPPSFQWPFEPATVHLGFGESVTTMTARLLNAVAGLRYEHQRWDRDEYIKINWDNIIDGYKDEFSVVKGYPPNLTEFRSFAYNSIMNVGWYYKSKNGLPTIEPLKEENKVIPFQKEIDMLRVNAKYSLLTDRLYLRGILYRMIGPVQCTVRN